MDLLGYLSDSLSSDERERVVEALARDPDLRRELASLRQRLSVLAHDEDFDPPPGLADRTIAAASDPLFTAARVSEWAASQPRLRMVEFCVVAAILLLAAVIVLPAIAIFRGEAGRVVCADNMRQLGVAIATYSALENGELPAADPNGPLNNAGVITLLLQARGLLPDANVLICPMADSSVVYIPQVTEYLAQPADSLMRELHRRQMGGSYGYSLGHQQGDVLEGPISGEHSAIVSDRPARPDDARHSSGNSPNHGGMGQNVLYADGHVEFLGSPNVGDDHLFLNARGRVAAGANVHDVCIAVSEATPFPRD